MLTRRQFLRAGASAAAGAATAALLPPGLRTALGAGPACGRLGDVEHVVILVQENRAFDHYFGRFPGVRGFDDRTVTQPDGTSVFEQRLDAAGTSRILPFHIDTTLQPASPQRPGECTKDPDHQWLTQHASWDGGALDRWVLAHVATNGPSDAPLVMGYYDRADLEFYWALASRFTVCDDYYCSVIGGTDINRLYVMSGTMDPDGFDGGAQFVDTRTADRQAWTGKLGAEGRWVTYPERLQQRGISWKVYGTTDSQSENNVLTYFKAYADPSSPLFARAFGSQNQGAVLADFAADCLAGSLPQVSWVLPQLVDSEHPPGPVEWGQDATYRVLEAITANPRLWSRTVLFVTYDENGGFFDHVPPPVAPQRTPGESLTGLRPGTPAWAETAEGSVRGPIGLGFRVPMLVVSPFSRGGFVCSDPFDHTSILRFLERRFGVEIPDYSAAARRPGLTRWRREQVGDLTSAFNFAGTPDAGDPALPAPNRADPRVLAECSASGEPAAFVDGGLGATYPVPAQQSMPSQYPGTALRPSGLRC